MGLNIFLHFTLKGVYLRGMYAGRNLAKLYLAPNIPYRWLLLIIMRVFEIGSVFRRSKNLPVRHVLLTWSQNVSRYVG